MSPNTGNRIPCLHRRMPSSCPHLMLSYLNAKILNLFYEVRMEIILLFCFAPCKYFNVSIFLTDIKIIIDTTDRQGYGQPIVGRDDVTDDLSAT